MSLTEREKKGDGRSGWFDGLRDAQIFESGKYLAPGHYDLTIREIKRFESSTEAGRRYFCVEFKIDACDIDYEQIETWQQEGKDSKEYGAAVQLRPGGNASWLVDLQKPSALGNIKGFCMSIMPMLDEDDITGAMVEELCEAEQPAAGVQIHAEAFYVRTRAGGTFTKVRWRLVEED